MKRVIKEQLIRRNDDDRSFDREFWQEVGHEGRFSAMWDMISEAEYMKGKNAGESRLQRSVQTIIRRKS